MEDTFFIKLVVVLCCLLVPGAYSGPIVAASGCAACCTAIHGMEWVIPWVTAVTTGACIVEACVPIPSPFPCHDPRDNICKALAMASEFLPSP